MDQDEFYEKIPDWISAPRDRWNHITLMAYFCHKYQIKNDVRFRLVRWRSDPGKGKESKDFARLFKTLAPENYASLPKQDKSLAKKVVIQKIYNYINWMFDYKFRSGERSVTGTNLFLMPAMINEFERMYTTFLEKGRTKNKVEALLEWGKRETPEVFEAHDLEDKKDLEMLRAYSVSYNLSKNSPECLLLERAKELELI